MTYRDAVTTEASEARMVKKRISMIFPGGRGVGKRAWGPAQVGSCDVEGESRRKKTKLFERSIRREVETF